MTEKKTFEIQLSTEESETVERAYFEAFSFEQLMGTLCKSLVNEDGNPKSDKAKEMLLFYAEPCRIAQGKLAIAQRMAIAKHIPNISSFDHWDSKFNFEDEKVVVNAYE